MAKRAKGESRVTVNAEQTPEQVAAALESGSLDAQTAAAVLRGDASPAVRLSGRFSAGDEVRLVERTSDQRPSARRAERSGIVATVDEESHVEFAGLDAGSPWWVVRLPEGEEGQPGYRPLLAVAVTAKVAAAPKRRTERPAPEDVVPNHVLSRDGEGDSRIRRPSRSPSGEGVPQARQEDVPLGTPQRSDTPTGEATPKKPDEQVPEISQDAAKGRAQRSATPEGTAALIPDGEVAGGTRQEHVAEEQPQRSATPHGEATPKPTGSTVVISRDRQSSKRKSEGGSRPPERADDAPEPNEPQTDAHAPEASTAAAGDPAPTS